MDQEENKPVDYGEHSYWDQRYSKTEGQRFEWLQNYQNLQAQIETLINHDLKSRILNIGCGNSAIQDHLYEAGYRNITNIDISSVVIAQMNKVKAEKGYESMVYEVMDVRNIAYNQQSFDLIIDKSTIDSLMCSDNPLTNVALMLEHCHRVLKPSGIYFVISYGVPSTRVEHLKREHVSWELSHKEIHSVNKEGQTLTHYLYICKKMPIAEEKKVSVWKQAFYSALRKKEQAEYSS